LFLSFLDSCQKETLNSKPTADFGNKENFGELERIEEKNSEETTQKFENLASERGSPQTPKNGKSSLNLNVF
jgi:hypothetical protein